MGQAHSTTADRKRSAKFYALKIDDCPGFPLGTTAIVMQGAWKEIKEIEEYDKVIYHDRQGVAHFGFVKFAGNHIILNKTMSQDMFPVQPTMIFPREEIKRCDLVVMISYREEGVDQLLRSIRQHQRLKSMMKATERRR